MIYLIPVIIKAIRTISKQFIYIIKLKSDSDFNSDNNMKFVNIDLLCNNLSIWLLINDFITYTKKNVYLKKKIKLINFQNPNLPRKKEYLLSKLAKKV